MELSVKGAHKSMVAITDGRPSHIGHVDIGDKSGIGTILPTIHNISKSNEIGGICNLIDAILLVKGECPLTTCPEAKHGQEHKK